MKRILSVILAVAMILVSGCTSKSNQGKTGNETKTQKLVVWCWDGAIQQLEDAAEAYKAKNANVEFDFQMISSEQIYDKLTPCLATGNGLPDVVVLEGEVMPRFAGKFPDKFADFTGKANTNDFLKSKVAEVTIGGKLLAMPWDAAPCAMFYRQDIFDKAGVNADDIKTFDDFIAAGKVVKEKTGVDMLAMSTVSGSALLRTLTMQQNSYYFDNDGNAKLNSPEVVLAMENVKKIYDAGITCDYSDWSEYISVMTNDKVACIFEAAWIVGNLKGDGAHLSGNWRVKEVPKVASNADGVAMNGGSAIAVTSTDDARKNIAMDYVIFATTDTKLQVDGFTKWGLYPSYIPAYSDPVFAKGDEYFGGQKIYDVINELAKDISSVNFTAYYRDARTATQNAVTRVCKNGQPVQQAMEEAQKELVNMMNQ